MPISGDIQKYLDSKGVSYDVLEHGEAETAAEEAKEARVPPEDVAKTLVIRRREGGDVLAVVRGADRLNMKAVRQAVEDSHARLATEDELSADYGSFDVGAAPPLPDVVNAPVLADPGVLGREQIVFPGGTHTASVKISVADWKGLASPRETPLAK